MPHSVVRPHCGHRRAAQRDDAEDDGDDEEAFPLLPVPPHGLAPASGRRGEEVVGPPGRADDLDMALGPIADRSGAGVREGPDGAKWRSVRLWSTWLGIGLVSYVSGLDNQTMYAWLSYATSYFGAYTSSYAALCGMQQVLVGVMKPPFARLADVAGRAKAYGVSISLYTLGLILIASSQDMATVWIGVALYSIGSTGTQMMQQIVIADWVCAQYRALAISLVSLPYLVNFVVASRLVAGICPSASCGASSTGGWRWGVGAMSVVVPASSGIIILVLMTWEKQTRGTALSASGCCGFLGRKNVLRALDLPGSLLTVGAWSLMLLSIHSAFGGQQSGDQVYRLLTILAGPSCLVALLGWEMKFAQEPLLRRHYLTAKNVMLPMMIGAADFFAFYCSWLNVYTWAMVVMDWSPGSANYFSNTQSLTLTLFAIFSGLFSAYTGRYKWQLFVGACIRALGIMLMIRFRGQRGQDGQGGDGVSTAGLVLPQVIQGIGGGIMGVQLQVAAQISCQPADVGMVTAFVLLMTEGGGAVGSAFAGAMQRTIIPKALALRAPHLSPPEVYAATGSPLSLLDQASWALGTANRSALIEAYAQYWHVVLRLALGSSIVAVICTLFVDDRGLSEHSVSSSNVGRHPFSLQEAECVEEASCTSAPLH